MINTDQKKIEELLTRGVEKIYPSAELLAKELATGRRLRLYCGFDPSAKSLHIGNAVLINKLAQFQALGHEVIFLIGDFTGMIGDPTDKQATRTQLTREQVTANAVNYERQAGAYLRFDGDNGAQTKRNSQWQDKLSFADVIKLAANFTVGQMIVRDMFQARMKEAKPIYLHEFFYPLAQAYDSVAMDVDLEIGGNDQMFNMMCGRDLMKILKNKEKFVLTLKLLTDEQGTKMGKTAGNAVFLDSEANDMFGQVMSWPDGFIIPALELATKHDWQDVLAIKEKLAGGANPMEIKLNLAEEIVALFHGQATAGEARTYFRDTVQEHSVPAEIKTIAGADILTASVNYFGAAKSKADIKRLVGQGAVSVNDIKIDNFNQTVASGDVIKIGKRDWFRIK